VIPQLEKDLKDYESAEKFSMLKGAVRAEDIAMVVSRSTGIPVSSLMLGEKDKLLKMEEELRRQVIGQAEAISAISNTVRVCRAGLHAHKRPLGSFLFLGPTGVGKTQLCKALAKFLFDT